MRSGIVFVVEFVKVLTKRCGFEWKKKKKANTVDEIVVII